MALEEKSLKNKVDKIQLSITHQNDWNWTGKYTKKKKTNKSDLTYQSL